jgi:hypothetical protein
MHHGPTEDGRDDHPGVEVDVGDLTEEHSRILLPAEYLPRGRGDLALGQDSGRHLVEQWLEQVVTGPGDQGHIDIRPAQGTRGEEAAEARPDHHHPGPPLVAVLGAHVPPPADVG